MSSHSNPMEFTATESGFEDGIGGASNEKSATGYHYILFGRQADERHPECSGVYFEYDDQIHGEVDCISRVTVGNDCVGFELRDGQDIVVRRGMTETQWSGFLRGIYDVFSDEIIHKG